jgi:hypothetical protein
MYICHTFSKERGFCRWRTNLLYETCLQSNLGRKPFSTSSIHGKHWRIFFICVLVLPQSHVVVDLFLPSHALTTTADVDVCSFETSLQID